MRAIHIFFLFLYESIPCGYSFKAPWRGASNENPYVFLRNNKNISIFQLKKKKKNALSRAKVEIECHFQQLVATSWQSLDEVMGTDAFKVN